MKSDGKSLPSAEKVFKKPAEGEAGELASLGTRTSQRSPSSEQVYGLKHTQRPVVND